MVADFPIVKHAGEGKKYTFAGVEIAFKVLKNETDLGWSLMEYQVPAGFKGPALHYHKVMEEGYYLLEGALTFTLNGKELELQAGSFVRIPPMTIHTFRNDTDQPARFLDFMSPGGFEGFYDELTILMKNEGQWPPKDMQALTALSMKYDTYSPDI